MRIIWKFPPTVKFFRWLQKLQTGWHTWRAEKSYTGDRLLHLNDWAKLLDSENVSELPSQYRFYRDLASRNCMVSLDEVVKVGDLGMARDVYLTDIYHAHNRGPLPIRWMAPEAIRDNKFTSQSDVWSYGVVLWEIATLAELPYQGFSNSEVLSQVKRGQHLHPPEDCHDVLGSLMLQCWQDNPNSRPTFFDICK